MRAKVYSAQPSISDLEQMFRSGEVSLSYDLRLSRAKSIGAFVRASENEKETIAKLSRILKCPKGVEALECFLKLIYDSLWRRRDPKKKKISFKAVPKGDVVSLRFWTLSDIPGDAFSRKLLRISSIRWRLKWPTLHL
ncbi:hypothetical protein TNCV_1731111 [Trichonephila clavipes]|nr:hypothetical protein TNCV_1731111 [Trichonephila clavipes]